MNKEENILNRLAAVEAAVGITPNGTVPVIDVVNDRRINKQNLAARWDTSCRTIDRLRTEPDFPAPEIANGRVYWWMSQFSGMNGRGLRLPNRNRRSTSRHK